MKGQKMKFEEFIKRIDEIISALEDNDISLDDSIKLFEEGTRLSDYCSECLKNAEQKITELKNKEAE